MIFIICTFVSLATEVTSNTATCTIILPVLAEMVRIVECTNNMKSYQRTEQIQNVIVNRTNNAKSIP